MVPPPHAHFSFPEGYPKCNGNHQAGALIYVWGLSATLLRSCQHCPPEVFPIPLLCKISSNTQPVDLLTMPKEPKKPWHYHPQCSNKHRMSPCQSQMWKSRNRRIQNSHCPHTFIPSPLYIPKEEGKNPLRCLSTNACNNASTCLPFRDVPWQFWHKKNSFLVIPSVS